MIIDVFRDNVIPLLNQDRAEKVNYVWGDSSYIREHLSIMKKSSGTAPYRFPLIGLYSPIDEMVDSEQYEARAVVRIIIAVNTLPEYTNEQRLEISFKKVLRPLYESLFRAIEKSKCFNIPYKGLSYTYTENYTFGKRGAIDFDGKEIDEKIDAIEIKNLELTIKKLNCYAHRL